MQKIKLIILTFLGFSNFSLAEVSKYGLNLTEGVTEVSHDIFNLHMIVLWLCVIIGIIVFGLMIYSIYTHRKSKGAVAANFHESTAVEILWTIIPLAILIAIAFPATTALIKIEDGGRADMSIKITGYQWKWQYQYLEQDISFFSSLASTSREQIKDPSDSRRQNVNYLLEVDNPLVVPINKKVRLLMTSNDVIHSWWVPATGVKQDAIPGFINDSWMRIDKPGTYRGQCAELCGKDHGFMPIVVIAKTQADYDIWLASKKEAATTAKTSGNKVWTKDDLMAQGKKVYLNACAACHGQTGAGILPVFPAMKGSKIATGDLTAHINIVMNGKPGTAMAAYKNQLSDVDLAAIITFERNAFDNNTGDVVQPTMIKSAR